MIDLHTHTTASDGRCSPEELVTRAAAAGVEVLGVADHDTVAACAMVADACGRVGIDFIPGIEITAVQEACDVHMLGYLLDTRSAVLEAFLAEQRQRRLDRIRAMIDLLSACGIHLDADAIFQPAVADPNKAVGRPWIARALIAAGYVQDTSEAFDLWLSRGRPAFVPRIAATPAEVIAKIHDAGGLASLAHPVLLEHDDWIPGYADVGLDALEAYHPEHDQPDTARYRAMATRLDLAVSGGSDYHGDDVHGGGGPGSVALPRPEFERLLARKPRGGPLSRS